MSDLPIYDDHKFVVVLNKKIDAGAIINAASHMMVALLKKASDEQKQKMSIVDYIDADGGLHPVSALSLVVLRADNSNKIRRARNMAIRGDIIYSDFTESMTKDSYVEQMERTKLLKEEDLEYWGLCLFGKISDINQITGKFSLWR